MQTINRYADLLPLGIEIRSSKPLNDRTKIKPVTAGHTFPIFQLHKEDFVVPFSFLRNESSYLFGSDLLNQPLVVAFYSVHWRGYGKQYLDSLEQLHADIQVMGGQLIVISSDDRRDLERVVALNGYTFPLAIDQNFQIARNAGLYLESDPLWDRVSGVDENAAPPAIYVIGQSQHIAFDFIDHYLDAKLDSRELLTAVYKASQARAIA